MIKNLILLVLIVLIQSNLEAQDEAERQRNFDKRVLFILDGSGSMNESWQNESKWEMAISTLANLIDSFQTMNKDFEIAIRVLGHQHARSEHRCDDSKLEIPFSKGLSYDKVYNTLRRMQPKGRTPLAYSIALSEQDFPKDITALHSVVLVTDGLENCDGNPCEVATKLRERNIFITPYIIGLGIDSLESQKLECIGKFIDTKDKTVFRTVVRTILTEVSTKTTLHIGFIDQDSNPIKIYIPYSLVDRRTKRDISNFIYSPISKKSLDTIQVNTQYEYELRIHTNPPMVIADKKIIQGIHQNWQIPLQLSSIDLELKDKKNQQNYQLSDPNQDNFQTVNNIQSYSYLVSDSIRLDFIQWPILSAKKPVKIELATIVPFVPKGNFQVKTIEAMDLSIFDKSWNFVKRLATEASIQKIELEAREYYLLFKRRTDPTQNTAFSSFRILEGQTFNIILP